MTLVSELGHKRATPWNEIMVREKWEETTFEKKGHFLQYYEILFNKSFWYARNIFDLNFVWYKWKEPQIFLKSGKFL